MESLDHLKNLPSSEFIQGLCKRLIEFRGSDVFDDDVCIICLDVD